MSTSISDVVKTNVDHLVNYYKELVADGFLSVDDAIQLTFAAMKDLGNILWVVGDPSLSLTKIATDMANKFYDEVVKPKIDSALPWVGSTVGQLLKPVLVNLAVSELNVFFQYLKTIGIRLGSTSPIGSNPVETVKLGRSIPQELLERLKAKTGCQHCCPKCEPKEGAN